MKIKSIQTSILTLVAIVGVNTPSQSFAKPLCTTVTQCEQLIRETQAQIRILQPTPNLTPVALNSNGHTIRLHSHDAESYCARQGGRLPTIREAVLALIPRALYNENQTDRGTSKVDPIGEETFYYDDHAYGRSQSIEGGTLNMTSPFWTSSTAPVAASSSRFASDLNYTFDETYGVILPMSRQEDIVLLVRCIKNQ